MVVFIAPPMRVDTSFVNISVIRGHYPSFNGNARSALINYYELFERQNRWARRAECLFFRASREYLHVRYPLVYIRFIFVPRIYAREFIRTALCRLIHFTLSGTCICMYTHMNTKPDIVLSEYSYYNALCYRVMYTRISTFDSH